MDFSEMTGRDVLGSCLEGQESLLAASGTVHSPITTRKSCRGSGDVALRSRTSSSTWPSTQVGTHRETAVTVLQPTSSSQDPTQDRLLSPACCP